MTTRTDLHRPSVLVPAHYRYVACDYLGNGYRGEDDGGIWDFIADERRELELDMARTGGALYQRQGRGTCDVCGANAVHVARFHYAPDNVYVTLGRDCAAKMHVGDPGAFKTFDARLKAGLEATKAHAKAQEVLAAANLTPAWRIYAAKWQDLPQRRGELWYEERTIRDVIAKLVKWGDLSEKQAGFVRDLLARIDERAAKLLAEAAKDAARADVPQTDARVAITGTVLTVKEAEGFRPGTTVTKILVEADAGGYKLWGTCPSGCDAERGARVSFSAKIQRSDKDPKFGFFSRPTKGTTLAPAPGAPAAEVAA